MGSEFAPKMSDRETQFLGRLVVQGCLDIGVLGQLERMIVETGEGLTSIVLKLGVLSEAQLLAELAAFSGLDIVSQLPETAVAVPELNLALLRAREVVPIAADSRLLRIARWDPLDAYVERALRFSTGLTLRSVLATRGQILDQLERLYPEPCDTDTPANHYPRRWT